jgi:hypothetical protein
MEDANRFLTTKSRRCSTRSKTKSFRA